MLFNKKVKLLPLSMLSILTIAGSYGADFNYPDGIEQYVAGTTVALSGVTYTCRSDDNRQAWCRNMAYAPNGVYGKEAWVSGDAPGPTPTPETRINYTFKLQNIDGGKLQGLASIILEDENGQAYHINGKPMRFNVPIEKLLDQAHRVCINWWDSDINGEGLQILPISQDCTSPMDSATILNHPAKISVRVLDVHEKNKDSIHIDALSAKHIAFITDEPLEIGLKPEGGKINYQLNSTSLKGLSYMLTIDDEAVKANGIHYIHTQVADDTKIRIQGMYTSEPFKEVTFNKHTVYTLNPNKPKIKIALRDHVFPDLHVKSWPAYLAMGTSTVNSSFSMNQMLTRPSIDAIVKYAGEGGDGDPGKIIEPEQSATKATLDNAQRLTKLHNHPVLPVMVFYSVQASGSWEQSQQQDLENMANLKKHYINLILLANYLQNNPIKLSDQAYYGSIILNPDFLGEAHKSSGMTLKELKKMPVEVKKALHYALRYVKTNYHINTNISLDGLGNTLPGYIKSLNRIINSIAPDVSFSWEDAVWAGQKEGHGWVHKAYHYPDLLNSVAKGEADFLKGLNVYGNKNPLDNPQYIAFDKYERDTIVQDKTSAPVTYKVLSPYLYNANDWSVYLKYAGNVSHELGDIPVMLWQIPGAHMITSAIDVANSADTAADYFLGDKNVADNVAQNIISTQLDALLQSMTGDYGLASDQRGISYLDYLKLIPTENLLSYDNFKAVNSPSGNYDWSYGHMHDLLENNVFAIMWGGGSTTGIAGDGVDQDDGGFLNNKIQKMKSTNQYYYLNGDVYLL